MTENAQAKPPPRKVNTWPQLIVAAILLALWCAWQTISRPGEAGRFGAALGSGNLDLFLAEWLGRSLLQVTLAVAVVGVVLTYVMWRKVKESQQLRTLGVLLAAGFLGSAAPYILLGLMLAQGPGQH